MSVWERLFGPRREARSACKANDADCFPSPSSPEPLCPRGYCMVHCTCTCRAREIVRMLDAEAENHR